MVTREGQASYGDRGRRGMGSLDRPGSVILTPRTVQGTAPKALNEIHIGVCAIGIRHGEKMPNNSADLSAFHQECVVSNW